MILLNKTYKEVQDNKVKLVYPIQIDEKYENQLCTDRADAILMGILHYAIIHKHNIESEMPLSEDLVYKIEKIFCRV